MEVNVKRIVEVTASADDWGLYDVPDREATAQYLNEYFERCVESGLSDTQTHTAMLNHMQRYSNFGAADSEGWVTLERLIQLTYFGA